MNTVACLTAAPQRAATDESSLQARVEAAAETPEGQAQLLAWLDERHPIHQDRGSAAVQRLRGAVLLALTRHGPLPREALLAVLEELDNGRSAYTVAAAAHGLHRAVAPQPAHALLLVGALRRLRDANDYVDLDSWGGEPACDSVSTTARGIVLTALRAQGAAANAAAPALRAWWVDDAASLTPEEATFARALIDSLPMVEDSPFCCDDTEGPLRALARRCRRLVRTPALDAVRLQDQHGHALRFADVFTGRPGIVVFFYTRCDNPDKCSLSVARLAQLQRRLIELGQADSVRLSGITYDPAFDDPPRLLAYGQVRGFEPRPGHRLLRASAGWPLLRDHFELGVGYLQGVVNRHRIEAHVHDAEGRIVVSYERLRWEIEDLLQDVLLLVPDLSRSEPVPPASASKPTSAVPVAPVAPVEPVARAAAGSAQAAGPLLLLLLALFPKCPICGVAYLSLAGIAALPTLPGPYLWLPVLLALLLAQLGLLAWMAWRRRRWTALLWSAAGTTLAVLGGLGMQVDAALWVGLALAGAGSLFTLLRSGQAWRSTLPD